MPWTRPASVPIGQVWMRFKGRERDGQPLRMYQIRDVDLDQRKRCLDMMQEHFLRDEPLCHALSIPSDPASIATIRKNWEGYIAQGASIACYTEVDGQPDELVGYNNLIVRTRDDEEDLDFDKIQGEPWKKLLRTLVAAEGLLDIFTHYGVDSYFAGSGMAVCPSHRGQNIGARFLETRELMGKAFGIPATATAFTATASQVLAKKCGFELLAVLQYEDMRSQGVDLSALDVKCAELRGKKFDFGTSV